MMKKLTALALGSVLLCGSMLPVMAAEGPIDPASVSHNEEESISMCESVLYYGTVKQIIKDEKGIMTQLHMESERDGEYVMNLAPETVWIDSGRHAASDPSTLQEGERIYVFHSCASTRSLPPQSAAFVIVRNIPMGTGCAQYHKVEEVSQVEGKLRLTTDQGSLILFTDAETTLSRYGDDAPLHAEDIQSGDTIMAWYDAVAESDPGQAYTHHLMLLPGTSDMDSDNNDAPLTRAELVSMLYQKAGTPETTAGEVDYTDVAAEAEYAAAVRWAAAEKLISGYGDGTFGPEDTLSREQLVTILWRYAGSPMLMDYTGLTQFSDVGELSRFAQLPMAWAHQQKLISAVADGRLDPQGPVSYELAETMLAAVTPRK